MIFTGCGLCVTLFITLESTQTFTSASWLESFRDGKTREVTECGSQVTTKHSPEVIVDGAWSASFSRDILSVLAAPETGKRH